jgi:threonylcarbamoyladenosine tRNA methylthiotransferase MtaB
MPHCAIGVDVIVGFPSETDEDFRETFNFLHSLDISYLHVFTYSERDNTHALSIKPVIPMNVRHERNKTLRNLSYMKMQYFTQQYTGQVRKTLFESHAKNARLPDGQGMMEGYTDNYIKITTPYKAEWVNEIVDWKI